MRREQQQEAAAFVATLQDDISFKARVTHPDDLIKLAKDFPAHVADIVAKCMRLRHVITDHSNLVAVLAACWDAEKYELTWKRQAPLCQALIHYAVRDMPHWVPNNDALLMLLCDPSVQYPYTEDRVPSLQHALLNAALQPDAVDYFSTMAAFCDAMQAVPCAVDTDLQAALLERCEQLLDVNDERSLNFLACVPPAVHQALVEQRWVDNPDFFTANINNPRQLAALADAMPSQAYNLFCEYMRSHDYQYPTLALVGHFQQYQKNNLLGFMLNDPARYLCDEHKLAAAKAAFPGHDQDFDQALQRDTSTYLSYLADTNEHEFLRLVPDSFALLTVAKQAEPQHADDIVIATLLNLPAYAPDLAALEKLFVQFRESQVRILDHYFNERVYFSRYGSCLFTLEQWAALSNDTLKQALMQRALQTMTVVEEERFGLDEVQRPYFDSHNEVYNYVDSTRANLSSRATPQATTTFVHEDLIQPLIPDADSWVACFASVDASNQQRLLELVDEQVLLPEFVPNHVQLIQLVDACHPDAFTRLLPWLERLVRAAAADTTQWLELTTVLARPALQQDPIKTQLEQRLNTIVNERVFDDITVADLGKVLEHASQHPDASVVHGFYRDVLARVIARDKPDIDAAWQAYLVEQQDYPPALEQFKRDSQNYPARLQDYTIAIKRWQRHIGTDVINPLPPTPVQAGARPVKPIKPTKPTVPIVPVAPSPTVLHEVVAQMSAAQATALFEYLLPDGAHHGLHILSEENEWYYQEVPLYALGISSYANLNDLLMILNHKGDEGKTLARRIAIAVGEDLRQANLTDVTVGKWFYTLAACLEQPVATTAYVAYAKAALAQGMDIENILGRDEAITTARNWQFMRALFSDADFDGNRESLANKYGETLLSNSQLNWITDADWVVVLINSAGREKGRLLSRVIQHTPARTVLENLIPDNPALISVAQCIQDKATAIQALTSWLVNDEDRFQRLLPDETALNNLMTQWPSAAAELAATFQCIVAKRWFTAVVAEIKGAQQLDQLTVLHERLTGSTDTLIMQLQNPSVRERFIAWFNSEFANTPRGHVIDVSVAAQEPDVVVAQVQGQLEALIAAKAHVRTQQLQEHVATVLHAYIAVLTQIPKATDAQQLEMLRGQAGQRLRELPTIFPEAPHLNNPVTAAEAPAVGVMIMQHLDAKNIFLGDSHDRFNTENLQSGTALQLTLHQHADWLTKQTRAQLMQKALVDGEGLGQAIAQDFADFTRPLATVPAVRDAYTKAVSKLEQIDNSTTACAAAFRRGVAQGFNQAQGTNVTGFTLGTLAKMARRNARMALSTVEKDHRAAITALQQSVQHQHSAVQAVRGNTQSAADKLNVFTTQQQQTADLAAQLEQLYEQLQAEQAAYQTEPAIFIPPNPFTALLTTVNEIKQQITTLHDDIAYQRAMVVWDACQVLRKDMEGISDAAAFKQQSPAWQRAVQQLVTQIDFSQVSPAARQRFKQAISATVTQATDAEDDAMLQAAVIAYFIQYCNKHLHILGQLHWYLFAKPASVPSATSSPVGVDSATATVSPAASGSTSSLDASITPTPGCQIHFSGSRVIADELSPYQEEDGKVLESNTGQAFKVSMNEQGYGKAVYDLQQKDTPDMRMATMLEMMMTVLNTCPEKVELRGDPHMVEVGKAFAALILLELTTHADLYSGYQFSIVPYPNKTTATVSQQVKADVETFMITVKADLEKAVGPDASSTCASEVQHILAAIKRNAASLDMSKSASAATGSSDNTACPRRLG